MTLELLAVLFVLQALGLITLVLILTSKAPPAPAADADDLGGRAVDLDDRIDAVDDDLTALTDSVEKLADQYDLVRPAADEPPVGMLTAVPAAWTEWTADGDSHFVQAAVWPAGGGVDLTVALNRAPMVLSASWVEFDAVVSLAARLRGLDPDAPARRMVARAVETPEEAEATRALWAQVIGDNDAVFNRRPHPTDPRAADTADAPNGADGPPAACPAGDCRGKGACQASPCQGDPKAAAWEDPDNAD